MTNLAYAAYLVISIAMTIWVARVLSQTGEVFLIKCFGQDTELAQSTNRLLVIGFYLVNVGLICARLDGWQVSQTGPIPDVGSRIGVSVLALGAMHFFNMYMIAKFGRVVTGWTSIRERDVNGNSKSTGPDVQRNIVPSVNGNGVGGSNVGGAGAASIAQFGDGARLWD
jgi:uncharacterized protein (DUF1800 family)